ncbi:MAG: UDP-N-acetylmuramate--L-alanine ligase [Calditrichaeota bacterium]|nr:MAG: UDP-N-acetylmuramate--L-alanine ligase [Calditrichota bacterium]MBL1206558.1 UDP-N-acetylmuramate--L-alanine ligase [Calditrichota bacterium]NOG46385.1 UDP-N-acetylmuramate--L-alanine ligase [Calditrichota bacterium]
MSLQKSKKKIHFIGIGGAGMSGLADILTEMGHKVSGSDREMSETTKYLQSRGITIFEGHAAENVSGVDLIVYSSAVPKENPEMTQANKDNIPMIRRAEMLGQLMMKKEGIAIAGTHGKTTTTSMTGQLLIDAGLDPTVVVGGKMQNLQTNARLGSGKYFVTEADEYDRSFLALHPGISVITSLEEDHLDIYKGLEDLKKTFLKFANQTMFDGASILCADEKNVAELAHKINTPTTTYGLGSEADIQAQNIRFENGKTWFDLSVKGIQKGEFEIKLPGNHNISNALASITVGLELGISLSVIKESLATFKGVQRRFEFKGEAAGILFYDDYAHHPSEVSAALNAAKSGWQNNIVVVFQPHLFSRTSDFYKEFAESLKIADKVILAKIYPAREKPMQGITSQLIANEIGSKVEYIAENEKLTDAICASVKKGDLVLTMGAGDIWKFGEEALKRIKNV